MDVLRRSVCLEKTEAKCFCCSSLAAHLHSGELVAVKVQRPGMSLSLTLDALLFQMIGGQLKRFSKARKDLLVAVNETVSLLYLNCIDSQPSLLLISVATYNICISEICLKLISSRSCIGFLTYKDNKILNPASMNFLVDIIYWMSCLHMILHLFASSDSLDVSSMHDITFI